MLAWVMNLGFAAGGTVQPAQPANTPGRHRKWDDSTGKIENLLATQTALAKLWADGLLTDKKRDELLRRVQANLRKAGYGKRIH